MNEDWGVLCDIVKESEIGDIEGDKEGDKEEVGKNKGREDRQLDEGDQWMPGAANPLAPCSQAV